MFQPALRHLLAALGLCLCLAVTTSGAAEGHHTVRSGQSLARIARRYHVAVASLAAANGLRRNASLRPGQRLVIPDRGVIYVGPGQTLGGIARANDVSVSDLMRANRLRRDTVLSVGRRLVLPGQDTARAMDAAAARWGRPRRAGRVTLYRIATRETLRMTLLDSRRRVRRSAMRRLTQFLRHRGDGERHRPDPGLVRLLVRVSDHFGGRRMVIVSGFRPAGGYTRETSRHTQGRAVDLRISGVPLTVLRDYLRSLDGTGVGYYPNSHFVHLDTRDHSGHWTDYSRPGEAPNYGPRRGRRGEDSATDHSPTDHGPTDHSPTDHSATPEGATRTE
ncbi:MAG: LysM peptidoglycan-binding domain-containing protein [Deltaproteobacteria bacterium]|nr:LysM peptidoglycan-binding domain-containing protein [Deltaproteobacteria bacterium]